MKKYFICMLIMLSASVSAQQVADADTVNEMIDYCKEVALEDGTGDKSMDEFLLNCVNDELTSEDYQKIKALPKS